MIHQASSSLTLTCVVAGQSNAQLSFQWTSTCTENCFVLGSRAQSVMRSSLRPEDSGNHTCMATDSLGNQGMATIKIIVVTVGKYNHYALGSLFFLKKKYCYDLMFTTAPTSSIFQLRILEIGTSCHNWRVSKINSDICFRSHRRPCMYFTLRST